jgi:hypothetical protein
MGNQTSQILGGAALNKCLKLNTSLHFLTVWSRGERHGAVFRHGDGVLKVRAWPPVFGHLSPVVG